MQPISSNASMSDFFGRVDVSLRLALLALGLLLCQALLALSPASRARQ